jgi:hypothetical protein
MEDNEQIGAASVMVFALGLIVFISAIVESSM